MTTQTNPYLDPPLSLRLAKTKSEGVPFMELLERRTGSPRAGGRMAAFIQEWGHLVDDLGKDPTVTQYTERWNVSPATVNRDLAAFRELFPTERTPRRILALLWDGLRDHYGALIAVRVVEVDGGDGA